MLFPNREKLSRNSFIIRVIGLLPRAVRLPGSVAAIHGDGVITAHVEQFDVLIFGPARCIQVLSPHAESLFTQLAIGPPQRDSRTIHHRNLSLAIDRHRVFDRARSHLWTNRLLRALLKPEAIRLLKSTGAIARTNGSQRFHCGRITDIENMDFPRGG